MTYERWQYYERQHGIKEGEAAGFAKGVSQGIAKQKAEDEKLLIAERERSEQKDFEIAELKAQLSKYQK